MVKKSEKFVIYILVILGVVFAGFMAWKSFTDQAEIVEANGDALYETRKTPFESTFGTKDDPTKVIFKKDGSILTFKLPYENISWEKTNQGLVANINEVLSFSYSILNSGDGNPIGIKEEIILQEKPENNEFDFSLDLQDLTAKKEGGLWHFYNNSNKEVFYIPKPFMEDANGTKSNDVEIKIDDKKLVVIADKNWLNSDERKYPIKIDPTLQLTVLTVQSYPEQGEIWDVEFTTQGSADLKIVPDDQQTIDDMDFISLTCDRQKMNPRILKDDVILYRNWECDGIGKVEHKITQQGNHKLKFEFGDQVDYAHNANWLGTWENRMEITVDNTNIDSDLDHFPVPIFLGTSVGQSNDDVSAVFDEVGSSWQKIAVTKDDGTSQLYVEKETWDSTAEKAVLWVSNSGFTLSNSATTTLYLYYDADQSNNTLYTGGTGSRTEVWDNNFIGVYHLAEDPSGAAPQMIDSTLQGFDGTSSGTMTSGDLVEGIVGDSLDFDGSNDYISVPDNAIHDTEGEVTVQANINTTASLSSVGLALHDLSNYKYLLYLTNSSATGIFYIRTASGVSSASYAGAANYFSDGNDHFLAGTFDKSLGSNRITLYENGSSLNTGNGYAEDISTGDEGLTIGQWNSSYYTDILDEVRVSDSARSAAWIKADYYAQDDNLLTFSTPTTYSAPSTTEASWLPNWSKRIKITIDNSNIDSSLTHFPIPIILSTSSGQYDEDVSIVFDELATNWQKIAVTEDDGTTQLYVEKEMWDSSSEKAVLWVSRSDFAISNTDTTDLYLYYDSTQSNNNDYVGGSGSGQSERTEVWDSNFEAVWHMSDPSTSINDSTSNDNDISGSGNPTYQQTGQIGYAIDFDGTGDYFHDATILDSDAQNQSQTLSLIIKADRNASDNYPIGTDTNAGYYIRIEDSGNGLNPNKAIFKIDDTVDDDFGWSNKDVADATAAWHGATQKIDTSSSEHLGFVDGIKNYTGVTTSVGDLDDNLIIGGRWNTGGGAPAGYFTGLLDEVRVSSTARSSAWIKANYYAQSDNLLDYGSEETSTTTTSTSGSNYFGDSSDGTGSFSANTSFSNTEDGDYVVKQYDGLTIDSGVTVTTANRAKGLMILVDGDATINGTLSMTDRGAYADPVTAGVSATGLRLPMIKTGETDTLAAADFSGAGTTVQSVVANQGGVSGNGKIYQIPRTGAGGGAGTTGAGNAGTTGTSGQTGGGGSGGGGSNASGDGGDGTAFSGGSASGGNHWAGSPDDGSDIAGPGTVGSCYYSSCGGGAGNPGSAGCCYGGTCSSGDYGNSGQDGTGGVVWLIVKGNLTIGAAGVIEANGSNGGNARFTAGGGGANGGGASAGGAVFVLYAGTLSNSGTVEAAGGTGGTSNTSKPGGDGGDGSVIIEQVSGNVAPSAPVSLKTEGEVNPTNVTDSTPEFTAVYNDLDSGDIANKYQIQVDDNSDFSSTIWDSGSSGTTMTNCTAGNRCSDISYGGSSLSEDVTYYWRIKFWDDDGTEGSWSTETATFSLILIPTNCRVKSIAQNGSNFDLTLEWTDNSSTETGFEIDKNTDGAGWTDLTTTAADATTYEDSNLSTESEYAYRVRANAATGNSDWCNISGYDLTTGNFNFEGLDFEGINID